MAPLCVCVSTISQPPRRAQYHDASWPLLKYLLPTFPLLLQFWTSWYTNSHWSFDVAIIALFLISSCSWFRQEGCKLWNIQRVRNFSLQSCVEYVPGLVPGRIHRLCNATRGTRPGISCLSSVIPIQFFLTLPSSTSARPPLITWAVPHWVLSFAGIIVKL